MDPNAPLLYFKSPAEWRVWLEQNGKSLPEVWMGFYKKDSTQTGITYEQAVLEALCYGWIDGLTKRVDEASYKVRFTPRKARSNWSASNIKRVQTLIENGRMTPEGLKHVDSAKADGRWTV